MTTKMWNAYRALEDGTRQWYASLNGEDWVPVSQRLTDADADDLAPYFGWQDHGDGTRTGHITYATRYLHWYGALILPPATR